MNTNTCPHCRAAIPADAPGGLCPSCALLGVVQPTVIVPPGNAAAREEVAAAFPELEIMEMIGQGGMGVVFRARQPRLDRVVALKILPPQLAVQPGFAERFTREARALARLNHPHIVTVYDFGESGGFYYLLMEYVDGVNLRQAMQAGVKPEQAMLLVPRICEALQFAHDHGVLHRDIKPENILLDIKGTPKLADFGIAKLAGDISSGLTMSGAQLGTASYMAPEQIEKPATVDHRADIYSLGVVFYEMLTGELPLGRFAAPSEKSAVSEGVDAVVLRALEKERDRRQQSAGEMKTQVEGVGVLDAAAQQEHGERRGPFTLFFLALCMLCGAMIPASGMLRIKGLDSSTFVAGTILCGVLMAIASMFERGGRHARRERRHVRPGNYSWQSISPRRVLGMPLFHIVRGPDPATGVVPVARGFFAAGPVARGVFAVGGQACGFIAAGGAAAGVVAIGGLTTGVFAFGGLTLGLLCAAGGLAVAPMAVGGSAAGLAAIGGSAFALEARAATLLYSGCQPLGDWFQGILLVIKITGGLTALAAVVLFQMSFFAREPSARELPAVAPRQLHPQSGPRWFILFFVAFALMLAIFALSRLLTRIPNSPVESVPLPLAGERAGAAPRPNN